VVVATTCMRMTRQFKWEDERGQRWFKTYRNRSAPDCLYKNLLRPIRSKTYKCLWNWLRTRSCSGALTLLFLTLPDSSSKLSTHCFPSRFASLTYRKRQLITDVVLIGIHVIVMCFKFAKDNSIVDITFTE